MTDIRTLLAEAAPQPSAPFDIDRLVVRAVRRPRRRRLTAWFMAALGVVGVGLPLRAALAPGGREADRIVTLPGPDAGSDAGLACPKVEGEARNVPPGPGPLHATLLGTMPAGRVIAAPNALGTDVVALGRADGRIGLCDLHTGRGWAVAPVLQRGDIRALDAGGSIVVWSEAVGSTVPHAIPGDAGRTWCIAVADVRTGRTREVYRRQRETAEYPLIPQPQTDGRYVVWSQETPRPSGDQEIVVYDLADGSTSVERYPDVGRVAVLDGVVYFDAATAGGSGRMVFSRPADGSRPARPVPGTDRASGVRAGGGRLGWLVDGGDRSAAAIWVLDLGDPDARPVHVGDAGAFRLGAGVVVLGTADGLYVHDGSAGGAPLRIGESAPFSPWDGGDADGDRVAWLDTTAHVGREEPWTVRIVRIDR